MYGIAIKCNRYNRLTDESWHLKFAEQFHFLYNVYTSQTLISTSHKLVWLVTYLKILDSLKIVVIINRFILCHMHHSTSIDEIETAITESGFSVRNVGNILNRTSNNCLYHCSMVNLITTSPTRVCSTSPNYFISKSSLKNRERFAISHNASGDNHTGPLGHICVHPTLNAASNVARIIWLKSEDCENSHNVPAHTHCQLQRLPVYTQRLPILAYDKKPQPLGSNRYRI